MTTHNLIISRIKPIFLHKIPKTKIPINCLTLSTSLFPHKPLKSMPFFQIRVHSVYPHNSSKNPSKTHFIFETLILCIFTLTLLSLRCISNVLLPDFAHRWNQLVAFSEAAEAKLSHYPSHLWQTVVAYEDRRFFTHFGIDPIGISRAMLSFSALGGGSTITQQLGHQSVFSGEEREFQRSNVKIRIKSGENKWGQPARPDPPLLKPISFQPILSFLSSFRYMGSLIFFLTVSLSCVIVSGISLSEFVYPNFSASNYRFIDGAGSFLFSGNGTFKAAMFNPGGQQIKFYLCVIHVVSDTIIWSANRDAPVSSLGIMSLDADGIKITEQDGSLKWSTPPLWSSVSALKLTDMGNLVLINKFNESLWESFHHPTDRIVIGQALPVGTLLSSANSDDDLSVGDYKLSITVNDAIMQWQNLPYWKLSMETKAYRNSNYAVDYLAINQTGLYLLGHNGSVVVIQVNLSPSNFRTAKLDSSGQFVISSFSAAEEKKDFVWPVDRCRMPFICGRIGLCTDDSQSGAPLCSCPSNFHAGSLYTSDCMPSDAYYSLMVSCNSTNNSSQLNSSSLISYLRFGYRTDYFANDFTTPIRYGVNLSVCQDLCSGHCSCLGFFYGSSSGSCYQLENVLGSFRLSSSSDNDRLGFIKTLAGSPSSKVDDNNDFSGQASKFPIIALVLLPFTGFFLFVSLGFFWWRRSRVSSTGKYKVSHPSSPSSGDLDAFSIPGLPMRFDYEELEAATDNFKTKIGSGGFGIVYKGTLPDGILVAVKKITNLGVQGKKDFCTEIAIIGNVHHTNLVKLKGFCAQGRERLLVYEYMNRGSLDCTLFGTGPVLEWQERVDIALGIARGLAYLHSGCEHKIIHCDVKPENILLQDHFQAKISDFGLSKLLSPEQSSLFTTMRGTRGYLAPEWLTSSAISDKTDVYSFGMVLLELVSGRKNCLFRTQSHSTNDDNSGGAASSYSSSLGLVYFPLFALDMHEQGRYLELADMRLEGRVTGEEVEKLIRVALCCVHEEPALRPSMGSVVSILEGEIPLCQPSTGSLNFLRFYGRRFAESSMIKDDSEQNSAMLYPQANTSYSRTRSGSNTYFSYISSHQISGPR